MSENDPIWIDGEVKLINASGATDLEGLWIDGEYVIFGEYVAAGGGLSIPIAMHHYKQLMGAN